MPSGKAAVRLEGIRKQYAREVLRVESLILEEGKIYSVIGPSGAGKSTLLRIINLMTPPDGGTISFNGSPVPPSGGARMLLQRQMTLVFQKPLLFKTSVWENVAYGLKVRNRSREEISSRVTALLGQLGLSDLAARRADTLSGGEAQRVALARAVAFEPRLLLLDEPTRGVDIGAKQEIYGLMNEWSRMGITLLLITSEMPELLALSDRIIVMHQGAITGRFNRGEATQESILAAAMGRTGTDEEGGSPQA